MMDFVLDAMVPPIQVRCAKCGAQGSLTSINRTLNNPAGIKAETEALLRSICRCAK